VDNRHWIFEWLAENHIESSADAKSLLPKYKVIESLRNRAELARKRDIAFSTTSIVAGKGIDLSSGGMICSAPECMRRQVDTLLKRVWHYFDTIVVDDALTPLLSGEWGGTKKELIETITCHLEPLIYLKQIGAVDLIRLSPKNCCQHWKEPARAEGLTNVLDAKKDIVEYLVRTATFECRDDDSGIPHLWMQHPDLPSTAAFPIGRRSEKALRRELATTVYQHTVGYLAADVRAGRMHKLPIGSVIPLEGKFLQMSGPPSVQDVLFRLELPILEQVPIKDLIEIRNGESEAFTAFRNALREAATERVKLATAETASVIAEQIRLDVIQPSLDNIRLHLAKAQGSLAKKIGVGIFLGALATGCGLLLGPVGLVPALAISAGIGTTVTATGTAAAKYLDETTDLSLEAMYFLWKATEHAH
jgi:hypothetical protein